MRQLTSLDAQFLAMETPRTWGHVSGLAVYDPSTTPTGHLTVQDGCPLASPRLHVPPPPEREPGERKPGRFEMLARALLGAPRQPLRAIRTLPTIVPNVGGLPGADAVPVVPTVGRAASRVRRIVSGSRDGEVLERPTTPVPRTRFNTRISPHRRFSFAQLSLDRIKAVKNELGITVNDVVVGMCASALRAWMLERDELPEEPLVAMVPVSVRTQEQMGTYGNRVSAMFAPIPTDEPDPRQPLLRAHE